MNRLIGAGAIGLLTFIGGVGVYMHRGQNTVLENPFSRSVNSVEKEQKAQSGNNTSPVAPGEHTYTLVTADGLSRSYLYHIPKRYDANKSYPVVFGFHGGGGNAEQFKVSSQLSPLADEKGFIVIYGQGTSAIKRAALQKTALGKLSIWNGGGCCGPAVDAENNIDDVGYVRAVLKDASSKYNIDKNRVYATGMSNGGVLSNRLACEASDIIAGIAPVSGTIAVSSCAPTRQIPILIIHGTADDKVPYVGGMGGAENSQNEFISVEKELADWGKRNGCSGPVITTSVKPGSTDGLTVDKLTYAGCKQPVVHYRINGGTHEWPSGSSRGDLPGKPTPSKALNASETLLNFFNL